MTELFPYLAFEKAKDAIAYYEEVFGAKNVKKIRSERRTSGTIWHDKRTGCRSYNAR